MAVNVIYKLKGIKVYHKEIALNLLALYPQLFIGCCFVQESGQLIADCLVLEMMKLFLFLKDIVNSFNEDLRLEGLPDIVGYSCLKAAALGRGFLISGQKYYRDLIEAQFFF